MIFAAIFRSLIGVCPKARSGLQKNCPVKIGPKMAFLEKICAIQQVYHIIPYHIISYHIKISTLGEVCSMIIKL